MAADKISFDSQAYEEIKKATNKAWKSTDKLIKIVENIKQSFESDFEGETQKAAITMLTSHLESLEKNSKNWTQLEYNTEFAKNAALDADKDMSSKINNQLRA